jgi:hypothetical protein
MEFINKTADFLGLSQQPSEPTEEMKPIVIDIELKKSPRHPPIEARLKRESSQYDTAPTLEDIEEKLTKADQARKVQLKRRANQHTDEKRNKVLLRKMCQEMESQMKTISELARVDSARAKRQQVLLKRINIAKKETEKLNQVA